jgi:hypothetical protein
MSTPEGRIKAKVKRRLREEFGDNIWSFWPVQTGFGAVPLETTSRAEGRSVFL